MGGAGNGLPFGDRFLDDEVFPLDVDLDITKISVHRDRERPFFELPPGIGVQVLDDKRPWLFRNFFRPIRALLRRRPSALMHPDDLAYGSTSLWTDLRNAGAEVVDTEVVVDGQFTTSRSPDDLRAFCPAIVEQFAARRVAH